MISVDLFSVHSVIRFYDAVIVFQHSCGKELRSGAHGGRHKVREQPVVLKCMAVSEQS